MNLLTYSLFVTGLWYVLGGSLISLRTRRFLFRIPLLRPLILLVECPACTAFWIGIFVSLYTTVVIENVPPLALPFVSTACGYLFGRLSGSIKPAYYRDVQENE